MKKLAVLLISMLLLISCTNKLEKVINELEEKSYITVQKSNVLLFSNDVDSILENKTNGKYTKIFTDAELKDRIKFENENKDYIKKHTIEESVEYLEDTFFMYEWETFNKNIPLVLKKIEVDVLSPIKNDMKSYKIANLFSVCAQSTLLDRDTYDNPKRKEIMENNNFEWQKKTYAEDQERIRKIKAQQ